MLPYTFTGRKERRKKGRMEGRREKEGKGELKGERETRRKREGQLVFTLNTHCIVNSYLEFVL